MDAANRIKVFTDKYPLIGPTFWIISIQYFIIQLIVALGWPLPYSFKFNTISDLGNTACGVYDSHYVCSPYFTWMNVSFIVLGATMIAGSSLIYQEFNKNKWNKIGFTFMALAGLGTILVGVFPENTISFLHFSGALLPFLLGNIALVIFAFSLGFEGKFKIYTLLSGIIALLALLLFITKNYLGLGIGGMERLVAHPQTVWLIAFGIYMSKDRFARAVKNKRFRHLLFGKHSQ
jgi:hypothetical membrane protein